MSTFPTALFDFISSNEDGAGYFNLAKDTFFEEVLDAYHLKVAGDISALLEEEFEILFKCMVDYYCANSYPYPGLGYLWNVVDAMLKEKKLGSSEKEFYSALKDSYGSLYSIIKFLSSYSVLLIFRIVFMPKNNLNSSNDYRRRVTFYNRLCISY